MKNTVIRFAQSSDYERAATLMQQVQELHVGWRPDIYKPCDTVLSQEEFLSAVSNENIIVAEYEREVVGLVSFMLRHVESDRQVTRDVLFIDVMVVDGQYRGKGIGHQLFDYIRDVADKLACDGIELQVNAHNTAAMEMYKKYGFAEKSINMELVQ